MRQVTAVLREGAVSCDIFPKPVLSSAGLPRAPDRCQSALVGLAATVPHCHSLKGVPTAPPLLLTALMMLEGRGTVLNTSPCICSHSHESCSHVHSNIQSYVSAWDVTIHVTMTQNLYHQGVRLCKETPLSIRSRHMHD
jgi:hypothetical protein